MATARSPATTMVIRTALPAPTVTLTPMVIPTATITIMATRITTTMPMRQSRATYWP
jgi:hypothetical protein